MTEQAMVQRPNALAAATAQVAPIQRSGLDTLDGGLQRPALAGLSQALNQSQPVTSLRRMGVAMNRPPVQRREDAPNRTGLPDGLKAGVEALSGLSLDHVRVHRNSPRPAQLQAHAFAQGSDIHLGPGQERHLPHEAWHVVQQAQGRVRPTLQLQGAVSVNDDHDLEREADRMGEEAAGGTAQMMPAAPVHPSPPGDGDAVVQCDVGYEFQMLRSEATKTAAPEPVVANEDDDDFGFSFEQDNQEEQPPVGNAEQDQPQVTHSVTPADWDVDLDQGNIEIATNRPLASQEEVETIVGEMAAFAGHVQPDQVLSVNGNIFAITQGDNSGQPQVNFDIATTDIAAQLPQIPQNHFDRLFSARLTEGDIRNFGWTPEKTTRQMQAVAAIPGLFDEVRDGLNARIAERFEAENLGTPTPDLLAKVADAFFIAASQVVQHINPGGLTKDVPILIKTSFIRLVEKIATDTPPAVDESTADIHLLDRDERMAAALRAAISDFAVPTAIGAFNAVNGLPADRDGDGEQEEERAQQGMDLLNAAGSLRGGGKGPAVTEDALGVLIELRRAPVTPIDRWVEFAQKAFAAVGELLELPQQEDSESSQGEDSESDSSESKEDAEEEASLSDH